MNAFIYRTPTGTSFLDAFQSCLLMKPGARRRIHASVFDCPGRISRAPAFSDAKGISFCELCRVDGFLSGHGIRIQKLVDTPSLAGGANILCQALCCQELASHWLFQNMVRTDLAFGCISWYSSSAFRNDRKDI